MATGDWKTFYAYYGTDKYRYIVDGVPSYWLHPSGLDANSERPYVYLLHCTFGHHGIFSLSPVFLLALVAWLVPAIARRSPLRDWVWLSAGLTVIVVGFYLTRTQNYNYGGNTAGLRWIFWLIPLWLVTCIPALDACAGGACFAIVSVARLLAVTTFSSWYPIDNPWQNPWLFRVMEQVGWIDYRHRPEEFTRPVTTFFPLLPADASAHEWIDFESAAPSGQPTRLRLADQGTVAKEGHKFRQVAAIWNRGTSAERTEVFTIDAEKFLAGETRQNFLVDEAQTAGDSGRHQEQAESFLQGLPTPRAYRREARSAM